MVIRSTEQTATEVWVPGQTIALFLVASQTQIRGALSRWIYVRKESLINPGNDHSLYSQQRCIEFVLLYEPGLEGCFV